MGLGKLRDGLAPTPPMGWNSWNRFRTRIDERLIRETADAMVASGMREAGYRYLVIDDGWHAPSRDARKDLVPDAEKFPSGIAALAEYVHARGLKFGIYTDAGTATCEGLPGSLGHERRDAERFASWGVDYLKVDWCHTEGLNPRATYATWRDALLATGRPIVLSICEWGRSRPWEWADTVGHLWRTSHDIKPTWESVVSILDLQSELHPFAGPDRWNDPDMLEVGNGMSEAEDRAHFSLWAILAAPLMAGNDVRTMSDAVREILTAREVIAVDQDPAGREGRRVRAEDGCEVWVKALVDPDARAVLLFNRNPSPRALRVSWRDVGWTASDHAAVRDLWARRDLGDFAGAYGTKVPPHDVALLRITRARAGVS